ncbi:uncharacterized protein LOC117121642 isoform X2 [Anneissia japonica]|nr:uncharacterized protein LOC117121642 isoform X2 [Anneissia japonica]
MWEEMPGKKGSSSADLCHIPYDGVPYIFQGAKKMDCEFGKFRKGAKVKDVPNRKKRKSKKCDCRAFIYLREILKFNQYKINQNSKYNRRTVSRRLRDQIIEAKIEDIPHEYRCYVQFPRVEDHKGHETGADAAILQMPNETRFFTDMTTSGPTPPTIKKSLEGMKNSIFSDTQTIKDLPVGRKAEIRKICNLLTKIKNNLYKVPCEEKLAKAKEHLQTAQKILSSACAVDSKSSGRSSLKKRKPEESQVDPLPRKLPKTTTLEQSSKLSVHGETQITAVQVIQLF